MNLWKDKQTPQWHFLILFRHFRFFSNLCTSPSPALLFSSSIAKGTSFRPQFSLPFASQQWSTESRWRCLLSPMDLAKIRYDPFATIFFHYIDESSSMIFFIIIILMSPVLWFFFYYHIRLYYNPCRRS